MPIIALPGVTAIARQQVLNPWEQALYNVLEDYFDKDQRKSNRHNVLSQVRLTDVINVNQPQIAIVGQQIVRANEMSFDILITDQQAKPIFIFEADGPSHLNPVQMHRDNVKDSLAKLADIPLFRVLVDGPLEHIEIVHAMADIADLEFDADYPVENHRGQLSAVNYGELRNRSKPHRLIEAADIELLLINHGWHFPPGWEFTTRYDLRD